MCYLVLQHFHPAEGNLVWRKYGIYRYLMLNDDVVHACTEHLMTYRQQCTQVLIVVDLVLGLVEVPTIEKYFRLQSL